MFVFRVGTWGDNVCINYPIRARGGRISMPKEEIPIIVICGNFRPGFRDFDACFTKCICGCDIWLSDKTQEERQAEVSKWKLL